MVERPSKTSKEKAMTQIHKRMKPFMKIGEIAVYQLKDIHCLPGMVQLTKWLEPIRPEVRYLLNEHHRISSDPTRICYIVYRSNRLSLFVNDLTDGEFERLSEDDDE